MDDFSPYDQDRNLAIIGEWKLTRNPQTNLFHVSRIDGGPVPQPLTSKWANLEDFRIAMNTLYPKPVEPVTEKTIGRVGLGEYPNDAGEYTKWEEGRRAQVQHQVGEYILTLDSRYRLYNVTRADGGPVPKGLVGKWQLADFKARAAKLDSIGTVKSSAIIHEPELAPVSQAKGPGLEDYLEARTTLSGKRGAK